MNTQTFKFKIVKLHIDTLFLFLNIEKVASIYTSYYLYKCDFKKRKCTLCNMQIIEFLSFKIQKSCQLSVGMK